MKILVLGDNESTYIYDYFDYERFKGVDFVISSGDLNAKYLSYVVTLLNVPLYYVPGNHDSRYLNEPPEGCIDIDRKIINHNGINIMGLGGSMWYNGGAYQYSEREMYVRYVKMKPMISFKGGVDIFVAHAPARGLGDGKDRCHQGFETYLKILKNYEPKIFVHGHQHLNYANNDRILHYNNTTIINSYEYYLFDYDDPEKRI